MKSFYKNVDMDGIVKLKSIKKDCLKTVLGLYKKANAGHIGSSLSCLDILVYIFFGQMEKNDKFILSKGHAAAALYTVLSKAGKIPAAILDTFYKEATLLAAHPPCTNKIAAIPFGTGSLGHGLSLASGIAFSNRFTSKNFNVFCVLSEGDLNEGSTWEAALFAAQHKISNLIVIIDNNGIQGFGKSSEVLNLDPLEDKLKAFGFTVARASDGNDFVSLDSALKKLGEASSGPKCIIAKTVKGRGVSYMENTLEWHYLPMSDEQYIKAMEEAGDNNA